MLLRLGETGASVTMGSQGTSRAHGVVSCMPTSSFVHHQQEVVEKYWGSETAHFLLETLKHHSLRSISRPYGGLGWGNAMSFTIMPPKEWLGSWKNPVLSAF